MERALGMECKAKILRNDMSLIDSTISLLPKSKISSPLPSGCTARFVPDLVGNPEDRFSRDATHIFKGHIDLPII